MSFPWFSHGHHVVSRSTLHGFKCGYHVVSILTTHGFQVYTTSLLWFPHDFPRWKCSFHGEIPQDRNNIISTSFLWVETMSFPGGKHMVSMLCLNCVLKLAWKLQISWFPYCLYVISMVSIWTPCLSKGGTPSQVWGVPWVPQYPDLVRGYLGYPPTQTLR